MMPTVRGRLTRTCDLALAACALAMAVDRRHRLTRSPGGAAAAPAPAPVRRLPRSSPSASDSARSAPESPVASPVAISTAMPSSASERSSDRIPSRASRSTPAVGSSSTSSDGLSTSARAIVTRTVSAASSSRSMRAAHCSAPARSSAENAWERAADWASPPRQLGDEQLVEHVAPFRAAKGAPAVADAATERAAAAACQIASLEAHHARVGRLDAGRDAQQRGATGAPQAPHGDQFAGVELQRHVAQHDALVRSLAVAPADVLELEQGHGVAARSLAGEAP